MFTEKILPTPSRKDLSSIKHVVNDGHIYIDLSHYLKSIEALEQCEQLLREVQKDGWSRDTMKMMDSTYCLTSQSCVQVGQL